MKWPFVRRSTYESLDRERGLRVMTIDQLSSENATLKIINATLNERLKVANDMTVRAEAMMTRALNLIDRAAGAILPPELPESAGGPAKSVTDNDRAAALKIRNERAKAAQRGVE